VTKPSPDAVAPIASAGEAERAIANLNKIMDRLIDTVEEETARYRAGRLRDAIELDEAKVELARAYAAESERVKEAQALGVSRYIRKPYTIENLGVAIKSELSR